MKETLYRAAYLLPITAAPITDGAILVRNGRIVSVGSFASLSSAFQDVPVVDFGQAILMPPLVNAHTHLELTDFPRWLCDVDEQALPEDFAEWILQVIRVKRERSPEEFVDALKNGLRQSLSCGTGVIVDILSRPELVEVYNSSPLLGRVDFELIGRDSTALPTLLNRAEEWLSGRINSVGLDRGLSPHAPYTVSKEILTGIVAFVETRRAALSIHTAESIAELSLLQHSRGVLAEKLYPAVGWEADQPPLRIDPIRYLDQSGALRASTLLVHSVHLSPAEIGHIGRAGSSVVLCPRSNERLDNGVAPVGQFLCRGINLALGTDGLSSNDSLSVWDEMEAAQRLYAEGLTPIQTVAMATINGAKALGLDAEVGSLVPGSGAHFLVLKPKNLPDRADLAPFLCRGERQQDIRKLFLHGVDVFPVK